MPAVLIQPVPAMALRARRVRLILICAAHVGALYLTACGAAAPANDQQRHIQEVVAAGGVVDSVLSIAEQLARFRVGVGQTDTLRHASASIDALVARWADAIAARDSVALNAMVLDRAEFVWLYYPGSPMSLPPYEAPPQLLWGQIIAASNEGARALLKQFGGKPIAIRHFRCPAAPLAQSGTLLHQSCVVSLRAAGHVLPEQRYFGTVVERDKRFKFLGYSNAL